MNPRRDWLWALLILLLAGCGTGDYSKPAANSESASSPKAEKLAVRVAAASDLKFALDEIVAEFHRHHPEVQVQPTYGSSGNFFAQLSNKAPFDMYLSADIEYPRKLIEQGLADKSSEFLYALGRVVVWVPTDSKLEIDKGLEVLADPAVRKIAIANPAHAPYGRAAEAAMKKLGVYDKVADRLVLGENVSQAAQFVETGAADVGIIALSLASAPAMKDKGRYWAIPSDAYPKLEQGGVTLNWAQSKTAADQLRAFISGPEGGAVLKRYGFTLPNE